jgi:hypothetical protein
VPDAAVFACAATGALSGVALAITGAAPATANDPSVAAVALVGVAWPFAPVATASLGAARAFFAPASAAATAALVAVADADAAAAESVVVCAGAAAADEVAALAADDVAAIAAAAMASGAVALPDPAGAAGALVEAMMTGIATAIGFGIGIVTDGPPGCAAPLGSAAEVLSEDDFPVDFEVLAFEGSEFEPVCWTVSPLVLVLASDG